MSRGRRRTAYIVLRLSITHAQIDPSLHLCRFILPYSRVGSPSPTSHCPSHSPSTRSTTDIFPIPLLHTVGTASPSISSLRASGPDSLEIFFRLDLRVVFRQDELVADVYAGLAAPVVAKF